MTEGKYFLVHYNLVLIIVFRIKWVRYLFVREIKFGKLIKTKL
jgi:hypothetical protein